MSQGLCKEALKEKAQDAVEERLERGGFRTLQQMAIDYETFNFPDKVEDLPNNGITFTLAEGQKWLKDFDEIQHIFLETDKANVRYLGLLWCSNARQLTIFDCRNYHGGLYAFSDFAKRIQ
jgi:hypothetical protein